MKQQTYKWPGTALNSGRRDLFLVYRPNQRITAAPGATRTPTALMGGRRQISNRIYYYISSSDCFYFQKYGSDSRRNATSCKSIPGKFRRLLPQPPSAPFIIFYVIIRGAGQYSTYKNFHTKNCTTGFYYRRFPAAIPSDTP